MAKKIGKKQLNAIADEVIRRLGGHVVIHRYDSYSTNSIYLKFDYGVAYSLRISDHDGKEYLKYRFNILSSMQGAAGKEERNREGFKMEFYSPDMVGACCRAILAAKAEKQLQYRSYRAVMLTAKENTKDQRGFWSGARLVTT